MTALQIRVKLWVACDSLCLSYANRQERSKKCHMKTSEARKDSELSPERSQKASSDANQPNYVWITSPCFYSFLSILLWSVWGTEEEEKGGEQIIQVLSGLDGSQEVLFVCFQPSWLLTGDTNLDISLFVTSDLSLVWQHSSWTQDWASVSQLGQQ